MSTAPQNFNWVIVRAACTVEKIFNELRLGIDEDIAAINSIRKLPENGCFQANLSPTTKVLTIAQLGAVSQRIRIRIEGKKITVEEECATSSRSTWSVEIGLNDEGRCILRLGEENELEQWQFRKRALENLFFGDEARP
jgi:hypothetical protein